MRRDLIIYKLNKNIEVVGMPKITFPLTSNSVDESNSHGSRIYLAKDTELINLDVMGRKGNEIKHNKAERNKQTVTQ